MADPLARWQRPWWAIPLVVFGIALGSVIVLVGRIEPVDEPLLGERSLTTLAVLALGTFAAGCLFLLPPRPRRWPFIVLAISVVVIASGGWLLHIAPHSWRDCAFTHEHDVDAMLRCQVRSERLDRLGTWLVPTGVLLLLTCWLTAAPGWLVRPARRLGTRPRLLAAVTVPLAAVMTAGALLGWHRYQRAAEHRHRAEAEHALARLTLPSGLARVRRGAICPTDGPDTRCAISPQLPTALRQQLSALLERGRSREACMLSRRHPQLPCDVQVFGTIAGYPALVFASPHFLRLKPGQRPPVGAVALSPRTTTLYFSGSDIHIYLLTPEDD